MVVIGEKISSVWSINQFISFPLHSNCKIKSTNSHHYYIVILATAAEGCNLRQCFARPSLIFCNLSRQHTTTTSHKNEKCKFSFKFYNEDVEVNTLCKSICKKLQTLLCWRRWVRLQCYQLMMVVLFVQRVFVGILYKNLLATLLVFVIENHIWEKERFHYLGNMFWSSEMPLPTSRLTIGPTLTGYFVRKEVGKPNDPIHHWDVPYVVWKDCFWPDLYCLLWELVSNWKIKSTQF